MKKMLLSLAALLCAVAANAQTVSVEKFLAEGNPWDKRYQSADYPRYAPDQFRQIADNIVAYQNEDGGWAKNVDMTAQLRPDSVIAALKPFRRASTLDNNNVYPQVEYLSTVFALTGDTTYRAAAARGVEYMLRTQYPNGGWRGWDADAVTFNDGVMEGVLSTWLDILYGEAAYAWVDDALRARILTSWERGLDAVLKCQYVQNGTKSVWPQQCDHQTMQPSKARAYELPSLTAGESAGLVMLLMRIKKPSAEVIDAVKCAVAWFERSKITGKRVVMVPVPEGLAEDPKIKKDRRLLDDPAGGPIWARYYELDTNRPFFSDREGRVLYSLAEVPAERRVGYAWYGEWGEKVLKKYPSWLAKVEKTDR